VSGTTGAPGDQVRAQWLDDAPGRNPRLYVARGSDSFIDAFTLGGDVRGGPPVLHLAATWPTSSRLPAQSVAVLSTTGWVVAAEGNRVVTYDARSSPPGAVVSVWSHPAVARWDQVAPDRDGRAVALGTGAGGAGFLAAVPGPESRSAAGTRLVPLPPGLLNEDLCCTAGGAWVAVQSVPPRRTDGTVYQYDPRAGVLTHRPYHGGRRVFPTWGRGTCVQGVYVFQQSSQVADEAARLLMLDERLNLVASFTYPPTVPGDALGPVNVDRTGNVWVSVFPREAGATSRPVLFDQFTPFLAPVRPCGLAPTDLTGHFRFTTPWARGNGSWYSRSLEEAQCARLSP
jgi:hypothetical protein